MIVAQQQQRFGEKKLRLYSMCHYLHNTILVHLYNIHSRRSGSLHICPFLLPYHHYHQTKRGCFFSLPQQIKGASVGRQRPDQLSRGAISTVLFLLTHQKNLGPIKGLKGPSASRAGHFPPFHCTATFHFSFPRLLCLYPSTILLPPSLIQLHTTA